MDNHQEKFDKLIDLLTKSYDKNGLVDECLTQIEDELSFSCFPSDSKADKDRIFNIYNVRSKIEQNLRNKDPFVIGYEDMLPNLKSTKIERINVTDITTNKGSYIIFSDLNYNEFIGILKSKRTLPEIRERMKDSDFDKELTFKNKTLINNAL